VGARAKHATATIAAFLQPPITPLFCSWNSDYTHTRVSLRVAALPLRRDEEEAFTRAFREGTSYHPSGEPSFPGCSTGSAVLCGSFRWLEPFAGGG
jgi:hypothetical protein